MVMMDLKMLVERMLRTFMKLMATCDSIVYISCSLKNS